MPALIIPKLDPNRDQAWAVVDKLRAARKGQSPIGL